MEKTWREAIIRVLKEAGTAMHYSDIAEAILTNGYYKPDGATPAATVNSQVSASIKADGVKSPYIRVSPGTFALRDVKETSNEPAPTSVATPSQDNDITGKFINAFGMYWQRDLVLWKKTPKLYGRSPASSFVIDFSKQRGVYLLYDHHTPVYVGRSTDQTISDRLFVHTNGRMAGRWNRFSWFGVLEPNNEGKLQETNSSLSESDIISTLEAILIETLEPPQNRRQGDGFAGREFIQDIDPEIKKKQLAATLRAIEQKLIDE